MKKLKNPKLNLLKVKKSIRSVVESAAEAIITIDPQGNVISWNNEAQNIFGFTEKKMVGQSISLIIPERFRKNFEKGMSSFANSDLKRFTLASPSLRALRKDGTEFPFEYEGSVWESAGKRYYTVIVKDITEKLKADEISSTLTAIVQSSGDAIIGKDLKGIILSWNKGAEEIYGYTADEMIGKSIDSIFPPGSDELDQILDSVSRGETIDHYQTHRITKNGDKIDISLTSSPIKDSYGNIIGLSSIARDITQQKKAERALEASEAQLTLVTSNMADIICQASTEGIYIYVSPSVKSVLGYEPEEMIGQSMFDFIHPNDTGVVTSCMQDAMGKCMTQSARYRYIKSDGSYLWISTKGTPLFDDKGEVIGFVCSSRDVTEQKNMEDALRESEEKYRSLIESAKDPIALYDENGIFLLSNKAGAHSLNMEPADLLGSSIWDLFPESAEMQMELIQKVFRTGEGVEVEIPIKFSGMVKWYSASIQPLYGT